METKLKDHTDKLMSTRSKLGGAHYTAHSHITNLMLMDRIEGRTVGPELEEKTSEPLERCEIQAELLRGSVLRFVRTVRRANNG